MLILLIKTTLNQNYFQKDSLDTSYVDVDAADLNGSSSDNTDPRNTVDTDTDADADADADADDDEEGDGNGDGDGYGEEEQCQSPEDAFQCNSGSPYTVQCKYVCDGTVQCGDGSDEDNELCQRVSLQRLRCGSDQEDFQCEEGDTLSTPCNNICDNKHDCDDGSDESPSLCWRPYPQPFEPNTVVVSEKEAIPAELDQCPTEEDFFRCADGSRSIPCYAICNGSPDCQDQSDEEAQLCERRGSTAEPTTRAPNPYEPRPAEPDQCPTDDDYFRCADGSDNVSCYDICNGNSECQDGSDEEPQMCELHRLSKEREIASNPYDTRQPQPEQCLDEDGYFQCTGSISRVPCYEVCNQEANCEDASDEDEEMCLRRNPPIPTTPSAPRSTEIHWPGLFPLQNLKTPSTIVCVSLLPLGI